MPGLDPASPAIIKMGDPVPTPRDGMTPFLDRLGIFFEHTAYKEWRLQIGNK